MTDSILNSVKKMCGLTEEYKAFDQDIIIYTNTAFSTLEQLGVGPAGGFAIEDENATWDTFLGNDLRLNSAKTYVYLRVRVLFDPPTTSYLISAMNDQIKELEWRLNMVKEVDKWVAPIPDFELE